MAEISIIIPTLDAASYLPALRAAIESQTLRPSEVVVIDSSSSDDTVVLAREYGWRAMEIDRRDFDHGATRNQAAMTASGSVLVFLSQDATPADAQWLATLVKPLAAGAAAAAYSRQLARPQASSKERYARLHNYPDRSHIRDLSDVDVYGILATFYSNVSSATTKAVFHDVGGFPERTIINEDGQYAAKLLESGYQIAYVAESRVIHSHDYDLVLQFRRNFDIGVSHAQAEGLMRRAGTTAAGLTFLRGQLDYVRREGTPLDVLEVVAEASAKFSGYHLGRRYELLPRALRRRFSWNANYWTADLRPRA